MILEGQDTSHLWLPYAQMKTMPRPLPVIGAQGSKIILADGRKLVDGISSWWSACHGYQHPHIIQAMQKQLQVLPHIMLGGLVHEPAMSLSERLCKITPGDLEHVFFSDSGSVAVEVALKMALQYWKNLEQPNKNKFLCFRHGYHGDTIGAMGVSDPEHSVDKAFRSTIAMQYVVDIPSDEYGFAEFTELLDGLHHTMAAIIIEPLVQGAGGMKFHSPDVLAEIHRLAKERNILFIADEIATGFGRIGSLFACEEAGIAPDILCLGKALTGGAIGMAATLATAEIFAAFYNEDPEKAFMHGPTYMANALACAAANASLDLFAKEPRLEQVAAIEAQMTLSLKPCQQLAHVVDVRVKGGFGVVQVAEGKLDKNALRQKFIEAGCWVRPFGDIVYLAPPFVIGEGDLDLLTKTVCRIVAEI